MALLGLVALAVEHTGEDLQIGRWLLILPVVAVRTCPRCTSCYPPLSPELFLLARVQRFVAPFPFSFSRALSTSLSASSTCVAG